MREMSISCYCLLKQTLSKVCSTVFCQQKVIGEPVRIFPVMVSDELKRINYKVRVMEEQRE
jgi:hypothetical protein